MECLNGWVSCDERGVVNIHCGTSEQIHENMGKECVNDEFLAVTPMTVSGCLRMWNYELSAPDV